MGLPEGRHVPSTRGYAPPDREHLDVAAAGTGDGGLDAEHRLTTRSRLHTRLLLLGRDRLYNWCA